MTALLDPAQLEERERRKLKQLEHQVRFNPRLNPQEIPAVPLETLLSSVMLCDVQRAIEAQVEERRRQKEKEEGARRAQEQEEERRLEREREQLQQQYVKDTERLRHREVKTRMYYTKIL